MGKDFMKKILGQIFFLGISLLFSTTLFAAQVGEYVSISGPIDDDLYLAGGEVDLYAAVDGDVVVAGGQLNLEGDVRADVTAAGGNVTLRGAVLDDARIAGGNLRVFASIGDDLVAAGGRLHLAAATDVGGSTWLSGGDVFVDGKIAQELHVNAGSVVIAGTIGGDTWVRAKHIEIRSTAIIKGKFNYSSPQPAIIAEGARIEGEVNHTPVDVPIAPLVTGVLLFGLFILISFVITAVVFYLIFPGIIERCSVTIRDAPWVSLGYGLAVFAGVPLVIIFLLSTGVGALLALVLLAAYLVVLLSGYIAGAYFIADIGLHKMKKDKASKVMRVFALALSIVALSLINIIPLLGSVANWFVLLAGIGALKRQVVVSYLSESGTQ